jgi:SAM-dependent methyltransferase
MIKSYSVNDFSIWDRVYDDHYSSCPVKLQFIIEIIKSSYSHSDLKKMKILDIGCGTGEISIALAKQGFNVVGIDPCESFILVANDKVKRLGVKAHFNINSIQDIKRDEKFDIILMVTNPIGYISSQKELFESLQTINEILAKNGTFIFDLINRFGENRDRTNTTVHNFKSGSRNVTVVRHREIDLVKCILVRNLEIYIKEKDIIIESRIGKEITKINLLSEICFLLDLIGFVNTRIFSDYKYPLEPPSNKSSEFVIITQNYEKHNEFQSK